MWLRKVRLALMLSSKVIEYPIAMSPRKNGISSKVVLSTVDDTPVNIDNFCSTYKTINKRSHTDVWFDIHLNLFGKPVLRE